QDGDVDAQLQGRVVNRGGPGERLAGRRVGRIRGPLDRNFAPVDLQLGWGSLKQLSELRLFDVMLINDGGEDILLGTIGSHGRSLLSRSLFQVQASGGVNPPRGNTREVHTPRSPKTLMFAC